MDFSSNGIGIVFRDEPPAAPDRGEPALLVHGFASSARTNWADTGWLRTLSEDGRRAVVFDHRGHGGERQAARPGRLRHAADGRGRAPPARPPRHRARRRDRLFHGRARRRLPGAGGAGPRPLGRVRRARHPPRARRRPAVRHRRRHGGALARRPDGPDAAHVPPLRRGRRQRPAGPRGLHPRLAPDPHRRRRRPHRRALPRGGRHAGTPWRATRAAWPNCCRAARCSTSPTATTTPRSATGPSRRASAPSRFLSRRP